MPTLILASSSPRRRELLAQLGVTCRVIAADIDETPQVGEKPENYVERLALAKARTVWTKELAGKIDATAHTAIPVLAADTCVVCNDTLFGKPQGREEAVQMLLQLSGQTHFVLTGTAIVMAGEASSIVCKTDVHFADVDRALAERYWETGEPAGKAGGYAIQGLGASFVRGVSGSYSNVVGLPLYETSCLLHNAGIDII